MKESVMEPGEKDQRTRILYMRCTKCHWSVTHEAWLVEQYKQKGCPNGCGIFFTSAEDITPADIQCKKCGKVFRSMKWLKQHKAAMHSY